MHSRSIVVHGVLMAGLLCLTACGPKIKTYPVTGTVKFADGKPLTGGTVEFSAENSDPAGLNGRGPIQPDGTFTIKTWIDNKEMDGAIEGLHKVVVIPPPPPRGNMESTTLTLPFQERFKSYDNSGLQFTVKAGEPNRYETVVEP